MKDLTNICTACPDYPRCNFNRERVYLISQLKYSFLNFNILTQGSSKVTNQEREQT